MLTRRALLTTACTGLSYALVRRGAAAQPSFYYLGPWEWRNQAWEPPLGTVGLLDFGKYEDYATPGSASRLTRPMGFFATTRPLPVGYALLGVGDCRDLHSAQRMRDVFEAELGYRPSGDTLAALCTDTLMAGDPTGQERWKPLMPQADLAMTVVLGQHGMIDGYQFKWGRGYTQQVQTVIQHEIASLYSSVELGIMLLASLQRVLDMLMQKYGVDDWHVFVPEKLWRHIPGPSPHWTSLTDNFNRADSTSLGTGGEGWSWTETLGDLKILTNRLAADSAGWCRAESDLSGSDMNVQSDFDLTTFEHASLHVRYASAADTTYRVRTTANIGDYTADMYKRVTGTDTLLGTATFSPPGSGRAHKEDVTGSLVTYYSATTTDQRIQVTDTGIAGNVRAGAGCSTGAVTWEDNWQSGESVAASTTHRFFTVF